MSRMAEAYRILDEASLEEGMRSIVEPYLEAVGERGKEDGIYLELYRQAEKEKGTIVICHGFCETAEKYHELIYYLHREGYQVAVLEHRGHGRSLRETEDKNVVYVDDFDTYVKDMNDAIEKRIRRMAEGGPLYLYAHSMGGCIGALYLEQYPDVFQRAVLSSPMLGVYTGGTPVWAARLLCGLLVLAGRGKSMIFKGHPFSGEPDFDHAGGESEERYLYYLQVCREREEYQTNAASYRWLQQAIRAGEKVMRPDGLRRIRTPILLCSAQKEFFVEREPQKLFVSRVPDARMTEYDTRHEIYRGNNRILEGHLQEVCDFLRV